MKLKIFEEKKEMEYTTERKKEILALGKYGNYNFVIYSFGAYPVAYVSLPDTHSLNYKEDKIFEKINCHGGITFTGKIIGLKGWAIGWDYAHSSDYVMSDFEFWGNGYPCTKHTTDEILQEVKNVIKQLKKLE